MPDVSPKIYNEITLRLILFIFYLSIGLFFEPIERHLQREELWMYRYPMMKSYISIYILWTILVVSSVVLILANYFFTKSKDDLVAATFAVTLSFVTTVVLTRLLKYTVGKPRPDFMNRCQPRTYLGNVNICMGSRHRIRQGRQSFPSGHASLAFSGLGFANLYLMGKLKTYHNKGVGESWRIVVSFLPIVVATVVGISRIVDNHHFGVDVLAGSLLGELITIVCYHQYYPPFYLVGCDVPYTVFPVPPKPPPPVRRRGRRLESPYATEGPD